MSSNEVLTLGLRYIEPPRKAILFNL